MSQVANTETIVKCPNCKNRFAVDGKPFDLLLARNELDNFKTELMVPIRKSFEESSLKKEKASYAKGYADGKEYIRRDLNALQKKIDNLPKWLKWLIGDKLK